MAWGSRTGVSDLIRRLSPSHSPPLESLTVLGSRNITPEDAGLLAKAVQQSTFLRELRMSGHVIGLRGAKAMGAMLQDNSMLNLLAIGDREFGDDAMMVLVNSGLRENGSLQTLDLSSKGLFRCHHVAEVLRCHPLLSDLILGGNNFSSPVAIEELCSAVPKCTTLTSLDLSNCELGDVAKISLGEMVKSARLLRSLKLNGNPHLGDKVGEAILSATMDHCFLSVLNMESCGLGIETAGAAAAVLSSPFCSLVELNFGRNPSLGSDGVTAIGKACVAPVSGGLKESGGSVSAPRSRSLRWLSLAGSAAGDTGVYAFKDWDERVSVLLDHLDLSSCGLTGEGASMVLRAGAVELRLFDNALEDKGVPIMIEAFFAADAASSLARLTALDVGGCCMSCSGISKLLGTLSEHHDGLRLIEMGGNDIGEDAEEAIMKAQMRRPLLDIVYRIGGNGLRRNG